MNDKRQHCRAYHHLCRSNVHRVKTWPTSWCNFSAFNLWLASRSSSRSSSELHLPTRAPKKGLKPLAPSYQDEHLDRMMAQRKFADISPESFFEEFAPETNPDHISIKKKIAAIIEEYENAKYTTMRVPANLTSHNMQALLDLWQGGHWERIRYLEALYDSERKNIVRKLRKADEQKIIGKNAQLSILCRDLRDLCSSIHTNIGHKLIVFKLSINCRCSQGDS